MKYLQKTSFQVITKNGHKKILIKYYCDLIIIKKDFYKAMEK